MRSFIISFFLLGTFFCAKSQTPIAQIPKAVIQDSTKVIQSFKTYWEMSAAFGKGINGQFIANTENVWANNLSIRGAKNYSKTLLGFGYDAQTIALKNTEKNKPSSGEVKNYGNPQHTFYAFADRVWRRKKTDFYIGILLGYSSGKANLIDSSSDFTKFESSKGFLAGGQAGAIYKLNNNWNLFFELEPKMYSLVFDYSNKNGIQKTVNYRIKVFPMMIGLKYNFR